MQTMREYETLYILKPDIGEDTLSQIQTRLSDVLDGQEAKVLRFNVWGKKKLAFEVAKNPKGIFVQLSYLAQPSSISELERNLRLIEPVVRFQTVKVSDSVDVEKRLAQQAAEDRTRKEAEAKAKAEAEERAAAAAAELAAKAAAEEQQVAEASEPDSAEAETEVKQDDEAPEEE